MEKIKKMMVCVFVSSIACGVFGGILYGWFWGMLWFIRRPDVDALHSLGIYVVGTITAYMTALVTYRLYVMK